MRRIVGIFVLGLLFVLVVLPAVIVKTCRYPDTSAARPGEAGVKSAGPDIRVFVHTTDEIVTMPLEEYVSGVVAAEMPTSFGLEALKAQAVAARTFAVRNMRSFGGQGVTGRPEADVTTDIWDGGQAWLSKTRARQEWGLFGFYGRWSKVEEAVTATAGLILTYDSVAIQATYHSTCGKATENSEDVWQEALPYLRGVDCPWCAHSPWIKHEREVTVGALEQAFGLGTGVLAASAGPGRPYVQVLSETPSGRAKLVRVGEKEVRVSEFRKALGLESARFTLTVSGNVLRFVTVGYGHGVGLCQYGADGMARAGKDFREILGFYYTGVEVEPLSTGF